MRDITPIGAISIHTPLAGSDEAGAAVLVKADVISIHTPLAGSDPCFKRSVILLHISIHTPLAGSDKLRNSIRRRHYYFNPHSPCGERPQK